MTVPTPKPAASVVLIRPRVDDGTPEIFFVKRHGKSKFMANAYVFPGGRVDPEDSADALLARLQGVDLADLTSRMDGVSSPEDAGGHLVAAIRETFEEAGVFLADGPEDKDALRAELLEPGSDFGELVAREDGALHGSALAYFAHWITPVAEPRRYDARFFIAEAPVAQIASHDQLETTDSCWLSARGAIAKYEAGEFSLAPPTWRILSDLSVFESTREMMAWARSLPTVAPILPVLTQANGELVLALPGDRLYPGATGEAEHRIVLRSGRWWASSE